MSRNRNQSNKAKQSIANQKASEAAKPDQISNAAKPNDLAEQKSVDNQSAAEKQTTNATQINKQNNTEVKENPADTKAAATETPKAEQKTMQKPELIAKDKTADVKPRAAVSQPQKTAQSPQSQSTGNPKSNNKPAAKTTASTNQKAEKKAETKPEQKKTEPAKQPHPQKAPDEKKSGSALPMIALLLGVAGTGLGAYSYNELSNLKSAASISSDYSAKITAIEAQLKELSEASDGDKQKQVIELISQVKALKTNEAVFSERVARVEQAQVGAVKNTSDKLGKQLSAINVTVENAQQEIENIKLGQQGLAKNISALSAGNESVSETGMASQEIGYLLRMADFKLASERDLKGATGLLQMAADRLVAANDNKNNALIDSIRATIIQLQGVKLVDENTLYIQLGQISRDIPLLLVKSDKPAATETTKSNNDKSDGETQENGSKGAFDKALAVFASGVKYTPSDPSKIDISAETVLIEKRLMQADIKTAEFAVRSHNKTLLSESFRSVRDKLDKNFAKDKTAKAIQSAMTDIEQSELTVVLPSLSGLIKQFEQVQ